MTLFQPKVLRFDSIDSTNLEAMRQARSGASDGLCIVAREQTLGRGRQGRSWASARDAGLYLTTLLRPQIEMGSWPLITLMSALAVAETLKVTCALTADIKWPNDLIVNQRKISGILCETVDTDAGLAAAVGIGINLDDSYLPPDVGITATSVKQETGQQPDLELLLNELIDALGRRYAVLQSNDGSKRTIREWCAHSSYARGKRVRVESGRETWEGVTDGLESDGALRVTVESGEIRIVRAGDVQALREQGGK